MGATEFNVDDLEGDFRNPRTMTSDATPSHGELGGVWEPCRKCRGTGRFISYGGRMLGQCFACKGAKGKTFKTSAPVRAANRQAVADRQARKAQDTWTTFAAGQPAIAEWIVAKAPTFDFAAKMREAVTKFGHLTDGQSAAINRMMAKDAERIEAREMAKASAPVVQVNAIADYFAKQFAAGKVRIKLRFDGVSFSPANSTGANPGAIYAKRHATKEFDYTGARVVSGVYLGKITGGRFHASRDCQPSDLDKIMAACASPLAAAKAYGKATGVCCVCGALLTDPNSIASGIGPICAGGF